VCIELHRHATGEIGFLAEVVCEHASRRSKEIDKVLLCQRDSADPNQATDWNDVSIPYVKH